jgi:hypothetical protein
MTALTPISSNGGKDLLSVLGQLLAMPIGYPLSLLVPIAVRSNQAEFDSKNMSEEEILCQISTFMAAGHETTR